MLRRGVIIMGLARDPLAQIRLNLALYSHNGPGANEAPLPYLTLLYLQSTVYSAKKEEQEHPQLHLAA